VYKKENKTVRTNRYFYNEDKDILELMDNGDFLDIQDTADYDMEDGYDKNTGEYHWVEFSHYTIPEKTNHFEYESINIGNDTFYED